MTTTTIDIPVAVAGVNAPTVDLAAYEATDRTFEYVGPSGSVVSIFGSDDGATYSTGAVLAMGANTPPVTLTNRCRFYRATTTAPGTSCKVNVTAGVSAGPPGPPGP